MGLSRKVSSLLLALTGALGVMTELGWAQSVREVAGAVSRVLPGGRLPESADPRCGLPGETGPSLFVPSVSWQDYSSAERVRASRPACPPGIVMDLCVSGPVAPLHPAPRPAVSEAEARAIFAYIAAQPMGWNYVYSGCASRAHVLSRFLEANGIATQKIFVDPSDGEWLGPRPGPPHFNGWPYHVATTVQVRRGGSEVTLVLDPA